MAIALCTQTQNYLSPNRLLSGNTVKRKCVNLNHLLFYTIKHIYIPGKE